MALSNAEKQRHYRERVTMVNDLLQRLNNCLQRAERMVVALEDIVADVRGLPHYPNLQDLRTHLDKAPMFSQGFPEDI